MSRRRNTSRTRDKGADIIQFPVERMQPDEDEWPVPADTEPEWPDHDAFDDVLVEVGDVTAGCEGCDGVAGSHEEFCPVMLDPVEYVGMTAHSVKTMCRWMHRHVEDGLTEPQPCCYSVHITISRLPGPVQVERNWLAYAEPEDDPA